MLKPAAVRELGGLRLPGGIYALIELIPDGAFLPDTDTRRVGDPIVKLTKLNPPAAMSRPYNTIEGSGRLHRGKGNVDAQFRIYHERKAEGLCVVCGKPAAIKRDGEPGIKCEHHRTINADSQRRSRTRRQ